MNYLVYDYFGDIHLFNTFPEILEKYGYRSFKELFQDRPLIKIFKIKEFIYNGHN